MSSRDAYIPWLDPLRGFAALSVLAFHCVALAALPIPSWYPLGWFRIGFLGVDLFFAISGAVILFSLQQLESRLGGFSRRAFAMRRLARIVPLYLLTGTCFLLVVKPDIAQRADAIQIVLAHLFFVQNLFPSTHGAINGPSWTLGVEMQFYLLVLLIGPWLLRASLARLVVFGLGTALLWRAAVWFWSVQRTGEEGNHVFVFSTQLPGVFDEFVAGMIAARWLMQRRAEARPLGSSSAAALTVVAIAAWGLVIGWMHVHIDDYWTHPIPVIFLRSAIALAAGLSVAAALAWPAPQRELSGLRACGDLSYGLYLWHMGALLLLQSAWPQAEPWSFASVVLAITIALSAITWRWVERPAQRAARAWERGRLASTPVSA